MAGCSRDRLADRTAHGNARVARSGSAYLVTCEHGGNEIPPPYVALFRSHGALLASHRGYDPGALAMARSLARALDARLLTSTISRLLVELNRSPGRQFRYSPVMRSATTRRPRRSLPALLHAALDGGGSVRARCGGERAARAARFVAFVHAVARWRRAPHGRRACCTTLPEPASARLCIAWQAALTARLPRWTTRRNYPYRGTGDGLTRYLRTRFDDASYCGIELEINQKHVRDGHAIAARERAAVVAGTARRARGGSWRSRWRFRFALKNASVRDHASFAAASS